MYGVLLKQTLTAANFLTLLLCQSRASMRENNYAVTAVYSRAVVEPRKVNNTIIIVHNPQHSVSNNNVKPRTL